MFLLEEKTCNVLNTSRVFNPQLLSWLLSNFFPNPLALLTRPSTKRIPSLFYTVHMVPHIPVTIGLTQGFNDW
jgi:hypothetical protein